jgi:hypothetical protein
LDLVPHKVLKANICSLYKVGDMWAVYQPWHWVWFEGIKIVWNKSFFAWLMVTVRPPYQVIKAGFHGKLSGAEKR